MFGTRILSDVCVYVHILFGLVFDFKSQSLHQETKSILILTGRLLSISYVYLVLATRPIAKTQEIRYGLNTNVLCVVRTPRKM